VPTSTATPSLSSRTTAATVPFTTAAASFTATANDIAATAAATAAKYSDRTEFRAREDGMTGSDFIKSYYIDEELSHSIHWLCLKMKSKYFYNPLD